MDSSKFFSKKYTMVIVALFCCLLWGSAFPAVKMLYSITEVTNTYQKMMLAGIRFSLAGIFVLIFLRFIQKKSLKVQKTNIKYILVIALLQTFLAYTFYYVGLSNTTGVRASIIVSIGIFNVAIMSLFAFKDFRLTSNKILGMILGVVGVILINLSAFSDSTGFSLQGEGYIIINTIFASLATIFIKKYASKMDIVLLNGYQLLIGGMLLIAVAFIGYPHLIYFSTQGLILLIYMSLLSAVAFSLWYVLLQHYEVASVTLFKFTIPIFGSMLSILFLPDEHFSLIVIPSLILIAFGIIIFTKSRFFMGRCPKPNSRD